MNSLFFMPAAEARYFTEVMLPLAANAPVCFEKAVIFISEPPTTILPPAYIKVNCVGEKPCTPSMPVAEMRFVFSMLRECSPPAAVFIS